MSRDGRRPCLLSCGAGRARKYRYSGVHCAKVRAGQPGREDASVKKKLRSQEWFGKRDKDGFIHRSWLKNQGYPDDLFDGRPVIGICNTWSELTPCNGHFRELAEFVKRGVYEAGGFPLEFPVMSLGETQLRPTAMLFRNLASMDVEESIRANPIDGRSEEHTSELQSQFHL